VNEEKSDALAERINASEVKMPQIPKPLHGMAPRVFLGDEWWQQEKMRAKMQTDNHCVACGVHRDDALEHQWMECHETYDINYYLGRMVYQRTIPLCHYCHNFIHAGRMEMMVEQKLMTRLKYESIIRRGNRILREAGLKKQKPYNGLCAQWKNWRLWIFGVSYAPVIRSYEEWEHKYARLNGDVIDQE
jgi:hypothetical protein